MPTTDLPDEPTPANPARIPKKPFTADEIRDLAEAMALPDVNNNVAAAAAVLRKKYPDTSYQRWYKIAKSNDYLSAIHPSSKPEEILPTNADAIDRVPLITPAEIEEHKALAKQERGLATGDWTALGVSEEQAKRMISMERFSRQPLSSMVGTTHGGMLFAYAGLLEVFEKCLSRFTSDSLPSELDRKGNERDPEDIQRDWLYALVAATAEIRQIKTAVDRSNLLMLKAEQLARELKRNKDGGGRKGRFGAAPLIAIKADAGSSVTVNESK